MNTYYEQWMAREEAWGRSLNVKQNKMLVIYLICTPLLCMALLYAIGLLAGGGALAVNNVKYGAIGGAIVDVLLLLFTLPTNPGKRYKKQLLKTLKETFSWEADVEEFAAQIMGKYGNDTVQYLSWKNKTTWEEHIWVTKDYILRTTSTGAVSLIQLKLVEQIELDAITNTQTAGGQDMKVRYSTREYPIVFRLYRDPDKKAGWKEKLLDSSPRLTFQSREARDQVVNAISRLSNR